MINDFVVALLSSGPRGFKRNRSYIILLLCSKKKFHGINTDPETNVLQYLSPELVASLMQ